MLRRLTRLWAIAALFMSTQAVALGLGEIRLDSALNEPLRAEITLLSATPEELENLTASMASPEAFARYGIDRPAYLQSVSVRVVQSGRPNGNVIQLTSTAPITEPFLTFLIEVSWSRGRLTREYTVLLDPPTFAAPPSAPITQTVQPPVRSEDADSGQIARPAPAPAPAPAAEPDAATSRVQAPSAAGQTQAPAQDPATDSSRPAGTSATTSTGSESAGATPAGDLTVQRGDTLWSLASRYRSDDRLSINQMMLVIYEANPQAFAGNINRLTAGASLRIPSANEAFRITNAEALAEVERQNSVWQSTSGTRVAAADSSAPSLELVPPDEDTLSDDSSGTYTGPDLPEQEADEPLSGLDAIRAAEIEDLLADQQDGLVVLSDNELAALRRELAELRGEPLPDEPAPIEDAAEPDVAAADDEVFVDDTDDAAETTADADAAQPDESATEAPAEPVAAETDSAQTRPASTRPSQQSFADTALGYLADYWIPIAVAVLVLLAIIVFLARRAASSDDEELTGMWSTVDDRDATGLSKTVEAPSIGDDSVRDDPIGDETIVVEESGGTINEDPAMTATMEIPASAAPPAAPAVPAAGADDAMEETFSSDTALNIDQSDPIAEADFHMAYGLYDQAADLINGALAVEPERTDLLAKLCEIYFVWGNRDAFIDAAERFKALLGDGEDPEWDKTVIMGQQIAGDHALFSDAPAGATKAVDLSFDDDDAAALDMDFAGEEADADVIDLGAEPDADPVGTATGLDFVFDDEESGQTVETAEMPTPEEDPFAAAFEDPEPSTREMAPFEEPTAEVPTAEMPAAEAPTTELEAVSEELTAEMPTVETSLDDDDTVETGVDYAALDDATAQMPAIGDDEATKVATLDDEPQADATAEIDLDDLGLDLDGLGDDLDATAEGEALDADDDLASTGLNEALTDLEETGRNEAIEDEEQNLLDATGHTQILPEDFAVDTGIKPALSPANDDDAETRLASLDDDEEPETLLASLDDEPETMLASLDDDEEPETLLASLDDDDERIEFAETESLPDGVFDDDAAQAGSTDLDLDIDDLTAALKVSSEGDTVNQGRDDATVEQPRPVANGDDSPTASIAPEEMAEDLHDARTMTEVGTKLDLARAYVDMGDPGGARSILEEVLDEGDESQRQQAQQLIDSLPAA